MSCARCKPNVTTVKPHRTRKRTHATPHTVFEQDKTRQGKAVRSCDSPTPQLVGNPSGLSLSHPTVQDIHSKQPAAGAHTRNPGPNRAVARASRGSPCACCWGEGTSMNPIKGRRRAQTCSSACAHDEGFRCTTRSTSFGSPQRVLCRVVHFFQFARGPDSLGTQPALHANEAPTAAQLSELLSDRIRGDGCQTQRRGWSDVFWRLEVYPCLIGAWHVRRVPDWSCRAARLGVDCR
jgi:hypothetical protein